MSKTTEADDIDALRNGLSELAPGRPVFVLNQLDDGLAELMLGASLRGARPNPTKQPHEYSGFSSKLIRAIHQPSAVDFFALMSEIPSSVYRIKGDVSLIERHNETHYRFKAVGQHWRVETLASASIESQLVVIGERENAKYETFCMDLRADLNKIKVPTMVLAGDQDPITPMQDSLDIVELMRDNLVTFVPVEGTGHGPWRDKPEEVFAHIKAFIESQ